MSQISENTEMSTFGEVLLTPLEEAENRQDIREVRVLMEIGRASCRERV